MAGDQGRVGLLEEFPMNIEDKLYTVTTKSDEESHLVLKDTLVCADCERKPCTIFCPAETYKWEDDKLLIAFENCLECGSCKVGCPYLNIEWRYPRGGFGVRFKFG